MPSEEKDDKTIALAMRYTESMDATDEAISSVTGFISAMFKLEFLIVPPLSEKDKTYVLTTIERYARELDQIPQLSSNIRDQLKKVYDKLQTEVIICNHKTKELNKC